MGAVTALFLAGCGGYAETVTYGNVPYDWPTPFPNLASIPQPVASGGNPPVVLYFPQPAPAPPISLAAVPSRTPAPTPPPAAAPATSLEALICSYDWPCSEALYVSGVESGGDAYAVNPSSGACGLFGLYPCECIEPTCNVARAYAKWVAGGRSFYAHWYRWWN